MTPNQEIAALCEEWPEWHIWRGRDILGQLSDWHATRRTGARSEILAASGPAELRQHLCETTSPQTGARP